MRIDRGGRKPDGEWASLHEIVGKGDGKRVEWETPFPAREARGMHVMRGFNVLSPSNEKRVLDADGKFLGEPQPDGYKLIVVAPDLPVKILFDRPVAYDVFIGVSVLGRQPENGVALKVLPMTDPIAKELDAKVPSEMRKRKREEIVALAPMQEMYREAWNRLVVDGYGFVDEKDEPFLFDDVNREASKKAILATLGSVYLGGFVIDRANAIQQERQTGRISELSD